jgi:hypothetical protein
VFLCSTGSFAAVEVIMILRLSQKLSTKIKVDTAKVLPPDDNPYADWTCHLFTVKRMQYVLLSNTPSLYSTVLHGKGITNDSQLMNRALDSLREFMQHDGQQLAYERFIAPASGTIQFSKSLGRSVTGSMNELVTHAIHWLTEGGLSPFDVSFKLNEILISSLSGPDGRRYGRPREVFNALLTRAP